MAQFEDYVEKTRAEEKDFYYAKQELTQLPDYDSPQKQIPYDVDQLTEKMNRRMAETTWEERTAYYFTDTQALMAKSVRYKRLSEDKDGQYGLSAGELAAEYNNHSAYKRRKCAGEASDSFQKAADLTKGLNKKQRGMPPGTLFQEREKIMRLRMKGMMKAAEAKSHNGRHESYLKCKARISCLTILSEQAERLWDQAKRECDEDSGRLLQKKVHALEEELKQARNGMKRVFPSAEETWQKEQGITDTAVKQRQRQESPKNPDIRIEKEDVKLLMQLEALKKQKNMDYPCHMVRLDRNGQPINVAEKRKQDWNETYRAAKEKKDQKLLEKATRDLILRVEQYPFPSPEELESEDPLALFRKHPVQYYEMFILAPKYFRTEGKDDPILKSYEEGHPYFKARREVIDAFSGRLLHRMRERHIDPEEARFLKPEQQAEKKEDRAFMSALTKAYNSMLEEEEKKKENHRGEEKKTETLYERQEALEHLRGINPSFTEQQRQILRELNAGKAEFMIMYPVLSRRLMRQNGDEIDGGVSLWAGLHRVHRDKEGKPLTGTDQKNLAHNKAWIKAFTEGDGEAQDAMIRQEFDSIFRDLELPPGDQFAEWMERKLEEDPDGLQELWMRLKGVSELLVSNETAQEYVENHPEFKACYNMIYPSLRELVHFGIGAKFAISQSYLNKTEPITEDKQATYRVKFQELLKERADAYKVNYQNAFSELPAMKEKNPKFNEMDYRILKVIKIDGATILHHQKQLQSINEEREKEPGWRLDPARNLSIGLHMYMTDQKGNPATENDREIEEMNQAWITAWVDKDEKKICKILDQELEECFGGITMPEPAHLVEWLRDQIENHTITFNELMRRNLGIDNIGEATPQLAKHMDDYWKEHPQYKRIAELSTRIAAYLPMFYRKYYRITYGNGPESEATVDTRYDNATSRRDFDENEKDMVENYKILYDSLQQEKQVVNQ